MGDVVPLLQAYQQMAPVGLSIAKLESQGTGLSLPHFACSVPLTGRFCHFKAADLRMMDVPELLKDYRRLLSASTQLP